MLLSALSIGLLLLQIVLIACTAWFLPRRLPKRWFSLPLFILITLIVWISYAVGAMLFDGLVQNDVPGIVYLIPGFLSGIAGAFVHLFQPNKNTAEAEQGAAANP